MSTHTRKPLVFATNAAVAQARKIMPGAVLENVVTDAIASGGMVGRDRPSGVAIVVADGVTAKCKETRSPLTGRRSWTIFEVQARRPLDEGRTP